MDNVIIGRNDGQEGRNGIDLDTQNPFTEFSGVPAYIPNQGSEGDRGVPATEWGGSGLHHFGEGSGERVPFFAAWCFPYPGQGFVHIAHRVPHRFWG